MVNHDRISEAFSPQLDAYLLITRARNKVHTDERGICSGYDDNEEAPIGCFVIKDDPVNKGVIHQ
jgi:hypothetical protein